MKIKELIKWTDIALSLRELFAEVKEALKIHDNQLIELQKQNLALLQKIASHEDAIDRLIDRIEFLEQINMTNGDGKIINNKIYLKKENSSLEHHNE